MNKFKIYRCPICKSKDLLYMDSLLKCSDCKLEFKIKDEIIDFRDFNTDKTAGFNLNKDNVIAKLLIKNFHSVKYFNGLFYIYEKLNKLSMSDLLNLNFDILLPQTQENDLKLTSAQSIHGYDIIKKINLFINDFKLQKYKKEICLENGCGLGFFVEGLSSEFSNVIILDFSISYLVLAKKICEEKNIRNVNFICANTENLPIQDNVIDFVHSNNVIEHVSNQSEMVSEINRSLKNNGFLFLLSPNKNSAYPDPHFRLSFYGFIPFFIRKWIVFKWFKRDCREVSLISLNQLRKILNLNFEGDYHFTFLPSKLKKTANNSPIRKVITYLLNFPILGSFFAFLINKLLIGIMPHHVVIGNKFKN